jgi:hypothetical protein
MKRALLIAGGTIGGLGAVLMITPPNFSETTQIAGGIPQVDPTAAPGNTAQPNAPKPTAPESFTGDAVTMRYGIVQVKITVQGGKIIDAQAVKVPTGSNDRYTQMSVPVLRERTLQNGLRRGLAELITDPVAYRGRLMDVEAATRWAGDQCESSVSILVGHSMGAATAMISAGASNHLEANGTNVFSAYIALSPQGAGLIFPENAWSAIKAPMLMVTGTRDTELGGRSWETRTEPFKRMPEGCKWLGIIEGATHLNFAGIGMSRSVEVLTAQTIGAFLDGVHRGDCRLEKPIDGIDVYTK